MITACSRCGNFLDDDKNCYECTGELIELIGRTEMKSEKFHPVDRPQHYGQGNIECIEYIEDFLSTEEYIGYLRGNIAKYLHRWRDKNGKQDLHKAAWYLERLADVQLPDKKTKR